ncbi:hypothetical protein KAFR_0A07900 [Kazachstania africana CBS 2517]|uniref:Pop1 N-terminal domain-containing protein n=1 Tax=Kazachstania africana (strain ATCC 22294 / BCRC 22015 / CBS 2517 / CECT 1963 / NBRC 1671 / NRRL Y-8276) TaxID=1071382 RepID=H2APC4_KAZAF|nr:hypothetical protein KAFR_0A07900 [Kazachstania africana CBS 2517]CCF56224.1 hypothetical protein KAFR_0A07900 [Kazachstania africana CBS 2517]
MSTKPTESGGKKTLNKNQKLRKKRVRNARSIRAEAIIASKSNTSNELTETGGILKVDQFINSRHYEINQLQIAMHRSKRSSSTRVFQALPRKLRRRTASHNIRRIPKRMRNRAIREMTKSAQQNPISPGLKGRKLHGLSSSALYKARMQVKLLRLAAKSNSLKLQLPEGATEAKVNLRQRIKLLNNAIKSSKRTTILKMNNRMGSYDNTGINEMAPIPRGRIKYYKRQRVFSWLPTHIWNAKRSHMMKRWGFQIPWSATQKCFKLSHRLGNSTAASDGALCIDSSFVGTMILRDNDSTGAFLKDLISKITNGRAILKKYYSSKCFFEGLLYDLNSHEVVLGPFDLLWINDVTVLLRLHPSLYSDLFNSLLQFKDNISIQDCRFSLASITLKGSKSSSALASILRSVGPSKSFEQLKLISRLTDPSVLPSKTMFAFNAIDPRHLANPKKITKPNKDLSVEQIMSLQTEFPATEFSSVLQRLVDPTERENSYKNQQTLKGLARRRRNLLLSDAANEHTSTIPHDSINDPSIPIVIIRRQKSMDWVVVMPWFWMLPFWYQLNRIPRIFNVGLRQVQQLNYEQRQLYFPDDYPFTSTGYMENNLYKRSSLKAKWDKKPRARRLNFEKIKDIHSVTLPSFTGEIGDYFSCDWKLLQILRNGIEFLTKNGEEVNMIESNKTTQFDDHKNRIVTVLNDLFELYKDEISADKVDDVVPVKFATALSEPVANKVSTLLDISTQALAIVPITCEVSGRGHPRDNARIYQIPSEHKIFWHNVVKGVYRSDGRIDHNQTIPLPKPHHLIGFITSGTFHLSEGRGVGNGFIDQKFAQEQKDKYILIRNVGTNVYRVAHWDYIHV